MYCHRGPSGSLWLIPSSLLVLLVLTAYLVLPPRSHYELPSNLQINTKNTFRAPKHNIWAELSRQEANDVNDFILKTRSDLNLTKQPKSAKDNFIYFVETLRPNKTDAVPYIFGDGAEPARYAKAAISESSSDGQPLMVFYRVGPLPISAETKMIPLSYVFNNGKHYAEIPVRNFYGVVRFGISLGVNISDITQSLLGAKVNPKDPRDPKGLVAFPRASRAESGGLTLWIQFFRQGMGSNALTLLPQGLYVHVNATSLDPSKWSVGEFYYNGILYQNEEAFRETLDQEDFVQTPANFDGPWTNTEDFESQPDGRELPPPVSIQPYGPRYKFDKEARFVKWFGFQFYVTSDQATGVHLFDIRFNDQRVMWELGMQEALSHYAGDDPMSGGQEFLDTFFGMGSVSFELVPGYDCPAYADFLDMEFHETYHTNTIHNSMCIFEYTGDYLLSRHTAEYSVTVSRNTYLVLRWVSTTGNYDYTFEYVFYLDGAIEVKVRASGFIFGSFFRANNTDSYDEYGHRVQEALSSSMHDHVINFKADLDVAGQKNDMVRLAIEPQTKSYPWDEPEQDCRNTMHIKEYAVNQETALDWPKNSAEFYIVYSDEKNSWGERRGYRIAAGTGMGSPSHLTILNSTRLGDSARWAEHDVWVLRRKDTEPRAADPLNWLSVQDPLINFNKMANHESLEHDEDSDYDGDLVIYFNVGSHHVPHSGDIPNTLMHTSASGVIFVPHNFGDRDPSRASVQGARLQLKGHKQSGGFGGGTPWVMLHGDTTESEDLKARTTKRNETQVHFFGTPYTENVKVPLDSIELDVQRYKTERNMVTDLSFNGSALGMWWAHDDE